MQNYAKRVAVASLMFAPRHRQETCVVPMYVSEYPCWQKPWPYQFLSNARQSQRQAI